MHRNIEFPRRNHIFLHIGGDTQILFSTDFIYVFFTNLASFTMLYNKFRSQVAFIPGNVSQLQLYQEIAHKIGSLQRI